MNGRAKAWISGRNMSNARLTVEQQAVHKEETASFYVKGAERQEPTAQRILLLANELLGLTSPRMCR